ncbi:hypothetical protein RF11_13101 [Thelohanellus kitauei]|uniref:Uncharacterized protein n=1 Tax=Thelohanellus kitauei TaxID=669202 RepID=A0A0C2MF88_THEKT|nr:hypothetical protein RF11_13101 [Thelohanellus kitauei]
MEHTWTKKLISTNPVLSRNRGKEITMIFALNRRNIINADETKFLIILRREGKFTIVSDNFRLHKSDLEFYNSDKYHGSKDLVSIKIEACVRVSHQNLADYTNQCLRTENSEYEDYTVESPSESEETLKINEDEETSDEDIMFCCDGSISPEDFWDPSVN